MGCSLAHDFFVTCICNKIVRQKCYVSHYGVLRGELHRPLILVANTWMPLTLCARYCSKCFIYINLVIPQQSSEVSTGITYIFRFILLICFVLFCFCYSSSEDIFPLISRKRGETELPPPWAPLSQTA